MPKLAEGKIWEKFGHRLHKQALKYFTKPTVKNRRALALTFRQIRQLEVYKDLGYETWNEYKIRTWGNPSMVEAYSRAGVMFERFPKVLELAPVGVISMKRLAMLSDVAMTETDLWWWVNLSRVTNVSEFKATINAAKKAALSSSTSSAPTFAVFWYASRHDALVKRGLEAAQNQLGKDATLGDKVVWLAATAIGEDVPRSIGHRPRAVRGRRRKGRFITLTGGASGGKAR